MSRLNVRLFGSFETVLDGSPQHAFTTDKARALLAYLVVESNRSHRRESLAAMFWPERPSSAARNNLRQTLYRLRKSLQDSQNPSQYLLVSVHEVQFDSTSNHWLDVAEFCDHIGQWHAHHHLRQTLCDICRSRLARAVELYDGDFLAGFSLPDSPAFEWWLLAKQEKFHSDALDALDVLGENREQTQEYAQAANYTGKEIALEPWRESAHRRRMRVLALSGQRKAALDHYQECCRLLEEELGTLPSDKTTQLYNKIRDGTMKHLPQ